MDSRRNDLEEDIKEVERLSRLTTNGHVQTILSASLKTLQEELALIPVISHDPVPAKSVPTGPQFRSIEKFAWEQHGKEVKVYVTNLPSLKTHLTDKIIVEFTRETIDIRVLDVCGEDFRFFVKQLAKPITDCRLKPTSKGFILTLKKAEDNYWDSFTFKSSPLNKSKTEKDDQEPGAQLMDMMRDMYQNVSP